MLKRTAGQLIEPHAQVKHCHLRETCFLSNGICTPAGRLWRLQLFDHFGIVGKHETMKRKHGFSGTSSHHISGPAYPFPGPRLLQDLHRELSAELGQPLTYDHLGKMTGEYRGSIHRWCHTITHPLLIAFMCLLEYLPPVRRQAFIDSHCRLYPQLPKDDKQLVNLLGQPGLTLISGGDDDRRCHLVGALGHACQPPGGKGDFVAGIDIHLPIRFVPVKGMAYIDGALGSGHVSQVAAELMPKLLTSAAPVLIFNGLWGCLAAWHQDILRAAQRKQVVLAEQRPPNLAELKSSIKAPINTITWSAGTLIIERG